MTRRHSCGGWLRRSDIKAVWDEQLRRTLYADTDPLVAHWKCDKCHEEVTQRKRQPRPGGRTS